MVHRWALLAALCVPTLVGVAASAAPAPPTPPSPPPAPLASPTPEFGGQCAMSLSEGSSVATDCSINWIAADGKRYCFGSAASKQRFLEDPQGNIERARNFLAASEVDINTERMAHYESADVQAYVSSVIAAAAAANNGAYPFFDPVTGQHLQLTFDHVDFVRTLAGYGFFPDVAFAAKDDPAKKYLIDFWIKPTQDHLQVFDSRIYKAPRRDGSGWMLQTRQPIPWWWIPASEHPGKTEQTRSWEVMSAVEEDIVQRRDDHHGSVQLTDPKTGEQLDLDFIGTHQPVRRLAQDGRYFMCTDFRKAGTTDQYYDIDFWVNEHAGKMSVDDVRVHKVPVKQEDGSFIQVPRYNFDALKFDIVP